MLLMITSVSDPPRRCDSGYAVRFPWMHNICITASKRAGYPRIARQVAAKAVEASDHCRACLATLGPRTLTGGLEFSGCF